MEGGSGWRGEGKWGKGEGSWDLVPPCPPLPGREQVGSKIEKTATYLGSSGKEWFIQDQPDSSLYSTPVTSP